MKVRYVGESFGVRMLTNGKVYECLGAEMEFLRVIDDEGEDYLYPAVRPAPLDGSSPGGRWEVIEDDEAGSIQKAINGEYKRYVDEFQ